MTSPSDLGLGAPFRVARRRLRLAWLVATGNSVLPAVGAAAVGLVLVGWLVPWGWPEPAAMVAVVGAILVVAAWAVLFPLPDARVARALERGLDQRDAITTALEVDRANPFAGRLHRRVAGLGVPDARRAVRLPFRGRPIAFGAVLLGAAAVLAVVRNPADEDRERLAAERAAVAETAETVEERAAELADDPETADLAAELEALAADLADERDLDRAVERLQEASAELADRTDAAALAQRAASLGLARTLENRPLAQGVAGTPAEQLAQLADGADDLSDEELAELADRLAELAGTQEAGDRETAEALADAAAAAAGGDPTGLASALGRASTSSAAAAAEARAGAAGDAAAADLDRLAEELRSRGDGQGDGRGQGRGDGQGSGQGQGQGSGQGQGQGQGSGQGQGQGQGQGSGQGQGQGQGQGGSGGGGRRPSGDNPSGLGSGQVASGQQGATGGSVAHPDAEAMVPVGGESDVLDAAAQATGDGTAADPTRVDGATSTGRATVPVRTVVGEYRTRAVSALDSLSLAPSETEAVQSYFDRLAAVTGGG